MILGASACADPDVLSGSFANLEQLQAEGSTARSWVPPWLPLTSSAMEETHNLDTNVSSLGLSFSPQEVWAPPNSCIAERAENVPEPVLTPPWWPRGVPSRSAGAARYTYFRCAMEVGEALLAVDKASGSLLFWRSYGSASKR
jgi:hypothetical protein